MLIVNFWFILSIWVSLYSLSDDEDKIVLTKYCAESTCRCCVVVTWHLQCPCDAVTPRPATRRSPGASCRDRRQHSTWPQSGCDLLRPPATSCHLLAPCSRGWARSAPPTRSTSPTSTTTRCPPSSGGSPTRTTTSLRRPQTRPSPRSWRGSRILSR